MSKNLKRGIVVFLILALTLGLVACGEKDEAQKAGASGVEVINVGSMGTYNPFSYTKDDGTLTGYDIEVLREIDKLDSSIEFNFISGPWDSLFVGLDADKFQMLGNQITSNPERVEKYYLTDNQYFTCVSQIIVKKGRTDIQSLHDLKGKTIGLSIGDSFTRLVEDWNAANGNILTIKYYEQDTAVILEDIENGRVDATVNDPIMAKNKAEVQGLEIDVVGERIAADPTYFIFKKDEKGKELKAKVDAALTQLIESGRLSELSVEWFGVDYTK